MYITVDYLDEYAEVFAETFCHFVVYIRVESDTSSTFLRDHSTLVGGNCNAFALIYFLMVNIFCPG